MRKVVLITPSPILLLIMAIAHSQNKIMSPETTKGAVFPLLFSVALLILLIWLIRQSHSNRRGDGGSGDFGDGFIGDGKK